MRLLKARATGTDAVAKALEISQPDIAQEPEARGAGMDLDERILQSVQEQLARIIGPMAEILIKRAIMKSSSLEQLYQILAEEIPTDSEREQFLESRDRLH